MNEKINFTTQAGTIVEANIICCFENLQNGKKYLYYTLNETVGAGANSTVKIYVSKLKQNDSILDEQISEEEWKTLKDIMAEVLKDVNNANIKYISTTEILEPISVSDRVIAMPVSYDYINKHRGIYAQAIATTEQVPVVETEVSPTPYNEPEVNVEPTLMDAPEVEEQVAPIIEPVMEETTSMEENLVVEQETLPAVEENTNINVYPIDLNEIEQKYVEMIETVNRLKEQELEAAKRYNATIELSAMHNEQHANYIANEQNKEIDTVAPIETPIEPEAVTPVIPEPTVAPITSPTDIETNWFDMPAA